MTVVGTSCLQQPEAARGFCQEVRGEQLPILRQIRGNCIAQVKEARAMTDKESRNSGNSCPAMSRLVMKFSHTTECDQRALAICWWRNRWAELNDVQKKYLLKMTDSALRKLLLVVNQILDWAKLESNQIVLDSQFMPDCSGGGG